MSAAEIKSSTTNAIKRIIFSERVPFADANPANNFFFIRQPSAAFLRFNNHFEKNVSGKESKAKNNPTAAGK